MSLNLTEDKEIAIELSDGSSRKYPTGITGFEIAKDLSTSLAKKSIACTVNGNLTDLSTKLTTDCSLTIHTSKDTEILYDLLKSRIHNISHYELPSFSSHKKFVDSYPYRYWYLISENDNVKGSFYIQNDNSIGIDLQNPSFLILKEIVNFINGKHIINNALPSQVPPYFFINVAKSNKEMLDMLEKIGCETIQVSLKINSSKK